MLQNRRNAIFIFIGIIIVAFWLLRPDSEPVSELSGTELPEDSPDVYITGLDLTRYDVNGIATMTTQAQTMAVYNERGQSVLTKPNVTLFDNSVDTWRITSNTAIVFDNDDVEFQSNVIAVQTTSNPPLIIASDSIRVQDKGTRIRSDLPVQILQGKQAIDAVGMEIELDTIKPIIHLLADVNFNYDPS